ncbi:MAG: prenyltransferase/squalene oxidase repeat-containing protein [Planctomycetota bacterium]|jgi:hypothetical protein
MILNSSQIQKNIDWLFTNGSAPIKYLTHKHLLNTAGSTKAMRSLWCDVENSPCVQEIFSKQEKNGSWHAGGSWAAKPSYTVKGGIDPYRPKYTTAVWILPLLGEMGYSATDKRIGKACRYVVSNGYFLNPIFSKPTNEISQSQTDLCPCRFAQYMIALGSVNFVDDVKVEKGYEVLLCMQGDDGGWVYQRHSEQMGWTRSCPYSTYHAVMALYYSKNPAYKEALIGGIKFLLWHLSTKKDHNLRQFFYHGHSMVRELAMFSELGIGLETRAVRTILKWLMTMYDAEEDCFRYTGKPVSKYTKKEDGIDSIVAKYRFYHMIENDWLTYNMTLIAANIMTKRRKKCLLQT